MGSDEPSLKYLYIAGLEHSGTTLLAQLLASQESVLALGEVGQFFSAQHISEYMERWGRFEEATLCSCGDDWSECEFWRDLISLRGSETVTEGLLGYQELIGHISSETRFRTIVDSSKSLKYMKAALNAWVAKAQNPSNFVVIVVAKDPRGFAYSISRKHARRHSFIAKYRSMSWWAAHYRTLMDSLPLIGCNATWISYEQLCANPAHVVQEIGKSIGVEFSERGRTDHTKSHIALGNKDFILRNRQQVLYDNGWESDLSARFAYVLSYRARRAHAELLRLAQ